MSNTPLVNTSGRRRLAMRSPSDARVAIFRSKRGRADGATSSAKPGSALEVLEDLDHALHAAGGSRDPDGIVAFLLTNDTHQVDDVLLGDDLDVVGVEPRRL